MITVHHLENSRSQRVLWMLEELGLDYEVKLYKRGPTMQAPESLRAVHPLGKSPVITDGAETLAESGAILEYLVETYGKGKLAPAQGTPGYRHYKYFLQPTLTRHFAFLDQHLAKHTWFAGDELTAADIQMSYPLEAAAERQNPH